jgi:hypothetical protein
MSALGDMAGQEAGDEEHRYRARRQNDQRDPGKDVDRSFCPFVILILFILILLVLSMRQRFAPPGSLL